MLFMMTRPSNQEFQWETAVKRMMVARTGVESGRNILNKMSQCEAPSILATSINSTGRPRKKLSTRMIFQVETSAGSTNPQIEFVKVSCFRTRNQGISPPENNMEKIRHHLKICFPGK